ncbi:MULTISPECIES: DUF2274 domain-containing protein [Bradyrhizobium]
MSSFDHFKTTGPVKLTIGLPAAVFMDLKSYADFDA